MIKKIQDEEMNGVAGGMDLPINNNKIINTNHDEDWKKKVREAAEKFDSQLFHCCVCGSCPGCGKMVGTAGNVCATCRQEAGCPSRKSIFR